MKPTGALLLLLFVFTGVAQAGQIFGSVKEGERTLPQGVPIVITCGTSSYSGQTDAYGSYSINVRQTGSCTLKVQRDNGCAPTFGIYSEDDPVRYDFMIVRQPPSNACALQRR